MINLLCIPHAEKRDDENPDGLTLMGLAEQLELARSKIFNMFVDSEEALLIMSLEYLESINNAVSPSDLFSLSLSDKPVEDLNEDQISPSAKQTELKIAAAFRQIIQKDLDPIQTSIIQSGKKVILGIHFLPSFLLQVSRQISGKTSSPGLGFNDNYLKEMSYLAKRMELLRTKMVTSNIGLVKFMARQYRTQHMSFEDLLQEGVIGLIKAVDRFDYSRKFRFSTYATYWVRQTIARSMSKNEKLIRIPINLAPKASAVFQMIDAKFLETNRWPSVSELATLCQMTEDEIGTILDFYRPIISLDKDNSGEDEASSIIEYMEQDQFPSAMKVIVDESLKNHLRTAVKSLPEKEAGVISCRYGLENQTEMTLQDIANTLRVTRERVRQIQNSGLKKLNLQFGGQLNAFLEAEQ